MPPHKDDVVYLNGSVTALPDKVRVSEDKEQVSYNGIAPLICAMLYFILQFPSYTMIWHLFSVSRLTHGYQVMIYVMYNLVVIANPAVAICSIICVKLKC